MIGIRFACCAALVTVSSPALAQWTRVTEVPATTIYSVWVMGDFVLATGDSVVFVSSDGGAGWKESVKLATGVTSVNAARARNGRIYAGTYGQGVFISDDEGDSWQAYNQGLTGGVLDAQRFIQDLVIRGDSLYAATAGDGPWVRNLTSGSWVHFSSVFEPNQASNMNSIDAGAPGLVASAGFNGTIFFRAPGQADWTLSWLNNTGIAPGLAALTAIWTGSRWVVGANTGIFYGASGVSPWTFSDVGLGTLLGVSFALRGSDVFAAFATGLTATIAYSLDEGASWNVLETLPSTFVFDLAIRDNTLYAARLDGLWRRPVTTVTTRRITWGSMKTIYGKPGR